LCVSGKRERLSCPEEFRLLFVAASALQSLALSGCGSNLEVPTAPRDPARPGKAQVTPGAVTSAAETREHCATTRA